MSKTVAFMFMAAMGVFAQAVNYTYDSGGHLVKATFGGGVVVTYTYNAAGHLTSRQTAASACAVTGDGQVSVTDVQAVINMALGVIPATAAADFSVDGVVNVVDVQTVTDVVLGTATCPK